MELCFTYKFTTYLIGWTVTNSNFEFWRKMINATCIPVKSLYLILILLLLEYVHFHHILIHWHPKSNSALYFCKQRQQLTILLCDHCAKPPAVEKKKKKEKKEQGSKMTHSSHFMNKRGMTMTVLGSLSLFRLWAVMIHVNITDVNFREWLFHPTLLERPLLSNTGPNLPDFK